MQNPHRLGVAALAAGTRGTAGASGTSVGCCSPLSVNLIPWATDSRCERLLYTKLKFKSLHPTCRLDMTSEPGDAMSLLTHRRRLLKAVEDGPASKQSLVEDVGVSRSTVDRAVRELEEAGLVSRTGGAVSLTTSGRVALLAHDRLSDTIRGLGAASELMRHLPLDSVPDPVIFQGGTVVAGTPEVPQRPATTLSGLVADAEALRGVALSVEPQLVSAGRDAIVERDVEMTVVVPETVVARLLGAHEDALEDSLEGGIDLRQTDRDVPFGVMTFERPEGPIAALLVYGESGLRGVVTNERDPAVAWARQYVETWLNRADPL
jgi:predicted transcriptional regulator